MQKAFEKSRSLSPLKTVFSFASTFISNRTITINAMFKFSCNTMAQKETKVIFDNLPNGVFNKKRSLSPIGRK